MGVTSRVPAICRERWPAPITVHRPRPRTRPAPAQMPAERGQHTVTARHGTRSQHGHSTRARKHGYIGAVTANRHIDTVTAQSQHGHSTVIARPTRHHRVHPAPQKCDLRSQADTARSQHTATAWPRHGHSTQQSPRSQHGHNTRHSRTRTHARVPGAATVDMTQHATVHGHSTVTAQSQHAHAHVPGAATVDMT